MAANPDSIIKQPDAIPRPCPVQPGARPPAAKRVWLAVLLMMPSTTILPNAPGGDLLLQRVRGLAGCQWIRCSRVGGVDRHRLYLAREIALAPGSPSPTRPRPHRPADRRPWCNAKVIAQ